MIGNVVFITIMAVCIGVLFRLITKNNRSYTSIIKLVNFIDNGASTYRFREGVEKRQYLDQVVPDLFRVLPKRVVHITIWGQTFTRQNTETGVSPETWNLTQIKQYARDELLKD